MSDTPHEPILLAGAGGEHRAQVRAALQAAGATLREEPGIGLPAAVDGGRIVAWVATEAGEIDRLTTLVEETPRLRIAHVMLFVSDPIRRTAWDTRPWPSGWDVLHFPLEPAALAQVLVRLRRMARGRNRGHITAPSRNAMAIGNNPFTIEFGFDLVLADEGRDGLAHPPLQALFDRLGPAATAQLIRALQRARRCDDWSAEWLLPREGQAQQPRLLMFRLLDADSQAPRLVGNCLVLDGDLGSSSTDPGLLRLLHSTASGGPISTWVWDIAAGTWHVKSGALPHGTDGAVHPQQAFDLVHAADRDTLRACLRDSLREGKRFVTECRLVLPGAGTHWYTIAGQPESDADGVRTRIVGLGLETTARKHAELALREAQQQLADSLDAGRMCLWSFQPSAGTLFVTGPGRDLFGHAPASLVELQTMVHADEQRAVTTAIDALLHQRAPLEIEFRLLGRDGIERWLRMSGTASAPTDAMLLRGSFVDITRRKRDELLGRDLTERLGIALEAAGLSPWSVDLRSGKRTPGPRDLDFFGAELRSLADFERHVLPSDLPAVRRLMERTVASPGQSTSIEFRVRHADGRIRWLSTRAHALGGGAGATPKLYGVTFDVTARRAAETAVQEGRRQLNDVLQAGRMVLWRWSQAQGFEVEFGASRQLHEHGPLRTHAFLRRVPRADRRRVREAFSHSLRFGLPYADEFNLFGADGSLLAVRVQGLPYARSEIDDARGVWGVLIDVSERKRIERERDEASARLYQALSAAGMTGFDLPVDAFRAQPEAALREVFGELAQVDLDALEQALGNAIATQGSFEHAYRHTASDGSVAWRHAFGRLEASGGDGRARIAGVLMDISQQKRAEIELEASRRWRDLAVEGAGMAVWEVDLISGARRGSPLEFALFGFSPSSREEFSLLVHPDDLNHAEHAWDRAVESGTPYSAEMRVRTVDGGLRWIAKHGRPVREPDSSRHIMVGITMDIDARKRAEAEQREALALARKASEAKSAFLASMSHEIRTPLNAVIGYTGLLADSVMPNPQRSYVDTLRGSAQQLLSLINDILDFSRIEAGELPLENLPFNLLDCIESSLDLVATQADSRGLTLAAVAGSGATRTVLGDVTRVRQIVVNLLSNAVKFTEHGGVVCEAELQPAGNSARIRIAVRDTGIGMDEVVRSRLFQPFQQGDASTTRRFGGTGLGLSICQRLVALLGGSIRVHSQPGQGSRFEVMLTLPLLDEPTLRIPLALPARVAIAVRSELLRDALLQQLAALRVETRVVSPAPDGLVPDPRDCDALIAVEPVFERLDAMPHYPRGVEGEPLPTLVLSTLEHGIGYGRHWQRIVRSTRTLKPSRLRLALHALHAGDTMPLPAQSAERNPTTPQNAARAPLRVLIAEDNAVNQKLLALQVESLGHRVQAVSSGQEAIDALRIDRFDLVLMDVEMPGMDGIETARRIREQFGERSEQLYIAAVTAHATQEMRQRLVTTVMDDFIAKPVVREELLAVLQRAGESTPPD